MSLSQSDLSWANGRFVLLFQGSSEVLKISLDSALYSSSGFLFSCVALNKVQAYQQLPSKKRFYSASNSSFLSQSSKYRSTRECGIKYNFIWGIKCFCQRNKGFSMSVPGVRRAGAHYAFWGAAPQLLASVMGLKHGSREPIAQAGCLLSAVLHLRHALPSQRPWGVGALGSIS